MMYCQDLGLREKNINKDRREILIVISKQIEQYQCILSSVEMRNNNHKKQINSNMFTI